jgi:nucleotide-binding universal stress UspA family protein
VSVFQRILVPVDGSDPSNAAVELGLRLAKEWTSELIFCNIVDTDRIMAESASVVTGGDPTPIIETMLASGEQLLSAASKEAKSAGLSTRTCLQREGNPVKGILDLAKREHVDLVMMGSHGRGGLSLLVMGSTTEGVLRSSEVPVLVVRERR